MAIACALTASCSVSSDPATRLGFAAASHGIADKAEENGSAAFRADDSKDGSVRPSPRPAQTAEAEAQEQEKEIAAVAGTDEPAADEPVMPPDDEKAVEGGSEAAEADQAVAGNTSEHPESNAPRSLLSAFFSPARAAPLANPKREAEAANPSEASAEDQSDKATAATQDEEPEKPVITRSSAEAAPIQASFSMDALPGVRAQDQLFEIKRKSAIDDDSDIDLYEDGGTYQVAAAAGLARLAPNGLLKQRESVDVSCFKPDLVRMLKTIERHYGRPVMVTSGYRSPEHNRRVRGARKSMHMYCAAADIQVDGVSPWELARFARSLPGRGGVGTYCHTKSVHVDVGPERDWNWRCRRKG